MDEPWVVLKFGGTSVAGRPQWERIAQRVSECRQSGERVLLVGSAIAGATDELARLARRPADRAAADAFVQRHALLAAELGIDGGDIVEAGRRALDEALAQQGAEPGPAHEAAVLAVGEWLSTQLGCAFLASRHRAAWVDAREALETLPEANPQAPRAWLNARCEARADRRLAAAWAGRGEALVTQGFVARAPDGRTALLGRGGSDTSAALLASRLQARRIEIWTDVPGLFSCDPALEPAARPVPELAYDEALEMAAGGARVIHGRSIRAAAAAGIPIEVRDAARPRQAGTRIGAPAGERSSGIRAVAALPGMAVLLLENLDTRQQVGFLAGVFETIARNGVSVDQVATSETTTTLAIDRAANLLDEARLDQLAGQLGEHCRVELFPDCSCVNLVGRGARRALGRLQPLAGFFADEPLYMASQSANDLCLSLVVRAAAAPRLVRLLHRHLVLGA